MHHPEQDITMPTLSPETLPEQTRLGIFNALHRLQEQTWTRVVEGAAAVVFGTSTLAACTPEEAAASAPNATASTSQTVEPSKATTPNPSAKTSPTDIPKATTAPNATPTTSPNTAPAVDNEAAIAFHRTLTKDAFNLLSHPEQLDVVWDRYVEMDANGYYGSFLSNYKNGKETVMPDGRGLYDHNPAAPNNMPSPTDSADKILGQILYADAYAIGCAEDKNASVNSITALNESCFYQLAAGRVHKVGASDRTGLYKTFERWPVSVQNRATSTPEFTDYKAISIKPTEERPAENDTDQPLAYKTLTFQTPNGTIVQYDVALVPFKYKGHDVGLWLPYRVNGKG